jgi:signal transduction histidine kinase/DNA-binding LacI/PurR family transcriptional regulator/CheY-like chemotaxis protein
MQSSSARAIPTIGVLAAWQVYEGTTIDGYLHSLLDGICVAARDRKCNLLLGCGVAPPVPRRRLLPAWSLQMSDALFVPVGPWNTDGLLIIPNGLSAERLEYVRNLMSDGCAIVFAGAPDLHPSVAVDNASGINQAIEHLIAHRHRQFAYIAGPVGQPGDSVERLDAFHVACQRRNIIIDPRLIAYADRPDDIESGRTAMHKILSANIPFSALLTFNDWVAIGAMETLKSVGRDTPRDVAVIGFDDRLNAQVQNPPLTTVRHPTFDLGYQSLIALLELMNGKWDGSTPIRIPTQLIVRQSCGCSERTALIQPGSDDVKEIGERSRTQSTRALIQQMEMGEQLGLMSSRLLAVLDAEQIGTILAEYLPSVGIRNIQAALFVPEEEDGVATSKSILRCGLNAPAKNEFITRHFPPPDFYSQDATFQLAVLPLIIQEQNVGFVAFDASNLEPCAVIMHNLAAALQSSRLYHDAAEGRRLAEEANRLKTRFLSMVSHELRTPLNIIVGLSKLILDEQTRGTNPAPQDLERIYASAQHLGFLIRDVLDLASSDAGQLRLTCERLELVEVIQAIAPTGEQLARDKGLHWRVKVSDATPPVWGDRTRLRQVVLNFISNAVKFTPQGTVTLAIEADVEHVTVSVTDTGLGIPSHERQTIFDEFHQSERTASRGYGGLGLGLAISRHLIEMHGGEIGVRSSGIEGEGATFYFRLPVMIAQPITTELAALPSSQVALVLTDQPEMGEQIRAYLENEGFPAITRIIAPQADWLAQVRQAAPAAVLIDRRLATERTWEIVQRLKQDPGMQDMPILFYTLAPENNTGGLLELDYRTKPLEPNQLANALKPSTQDQPKIILIVDDDPHILDLHTRLVKQQLPDCQVLQAHHGREALAMIEHIRPDLILLDLMMPELDGFGVLEALRSRESTRDIPVIVLTARTLNEADMARLNRGVVSVLEKGVLNVDETLARVATVLTHVNQFGSATKRLVRKAMVYLHEHYTEPLTREQIAQHIGVSESHLANCFHQELGISPMMYLNRYRIKQARALLEAGELNVTEVALSVGFSDSAYFGRLFQREVGISPGAYRRGHRKH